MGYDQLKKFKRLSLTFGTRERFHVEVDAKISNGRTLS